MLRKYLLMAVLIPSVVFTSAAAAMWIAPGPHRFLVPGLFGMTERAPGLYVEDSLTSARFDQIAGALSRARSRISVAYGPLQANPTFILCASEACDRKFGGGGAKAVAYGGAFIRVSPRGLNETILTHELAHAELQHRLGTGAMLKREITRQGLPSWFDEGLAMILSQDARYGEPAWAAAVAAGIQAPDLKDIVTARDWMRLQRNNPNAYLAAAHHVRDWLSKAGPAGPAELVKRIAAGEDFKKAAAELEHVARSETRIDKMMRQKQ